MAARTYCKLLEPVEYPDRLQELLKQPCANQNAVHGRLLCAKYIIKAQIPLLDHAMRVDSLLIFEGLHQSLDLVASAYIRLYEDNQCLITRSAYVDVVNCLAEVLLQTDSSISQPTKRWRAIGLPQFRARFLELSSRVLDGSEHDRHMSFGTSAHYLLSPILLKPIEQLRVLQSMEQPDQPELEHSDPKPFLIRDFDILGELKPEEADRCLCILE
ncbi:hypothetical protein LTS18_002504, partial [Coniosporium uncinatum]